MLRSLIVIPAFLLAACVSITPITPAGKDTYLIAGSNGMDEGPKGVNIKATLYAKANSHCESLGKKFSPLNESVTARTAELRFRCLYENDPEYKRPNMTAVPDVKVESN